MRVQSVEVWEAMLENRGFMSCQETPTRIIIGSVLLQVNILLLFSLVIWPFDVGIWQQDGEEPGHLPQGGGGGALLQRIRESY